MCIFTTGGLQMYTTCLSHMQPDLVIRLVILSLLETFLKICPFFLLLAREDMNPGVSQAKGRDFLQICLYNFFLYRFFSDAYQPFCILRCSIQALMNRSLRLSRKDLPMLCLSWLKPVKLHDQFNEMEQAHYYKWIFFLTEQFSTELSANLVWGTSYPIVCLFPTKLQSRLPIVWFIAMVWPSG